MDTRLVDNTEARREGNRGSEGGTNVVSGSIGNGTEAIEDIGSIEDRSVGIISDERRHVKNRL